MGFGFGPELAVMDCGKREGGRAYAFGSQLGQCRGGEKGSGRGGEGVETFGHLWAITHCQYMCMYILYIYCLYFARATYVSYYHMCLQPGMCTPKCTPTVGLLRGHSEGLFENLGLFLVLFSSGTCVPRVA